MAKNLRGGSAGMVHVVAAAIRTAGTAVVEQGWTGFCVTDAASGATYSLDCRPFVKYEITKIGAEVKGDYVYLTVADNTLSLVAAVGKKLFAKVVEAENGTIYGTPAGKTLVAIQPQAVVG